jgi:hypothetical protein
MTSAFGNQHSNDWLIVPGLRIGPITAKTTHADLIRLFGQENVSEGSGNVADIPFTHGTNIYKKTPSESATASGLGRR